MMLVVLKILGCCRLKDWMMLVYVCFIVSRNAEFLLRESFLVCNVCWIDEHNNTTNCLVHLSTSWQTLQTAMKTHLQFLFSFSFLLIYFRLMPSSAMTDDPTHITVFIFRSFFTPPSCLIILWEWENHGGSITVYAFLLQSLNFAVMDVGLIEKVHEQVR